VSWFTSSRENSSQTERRLSSVWWPRSTTPSASSIRSSWWKKRAPRRACWEQPGRSPRRVCFARSVPTASHYSGHAQSWRPGRQGVTQVGGEEDIFSIERSGCCVHPGDRLFERVLLGHELHPFARFSVCRQAEHSPSFHPAAQYRHIRQTGLLELLRRHG
jgi:hypothetical protein